MPDRETRELIGQMLVFGFQGHSVQKELQGFLKESCCRWTILFARNLASPVQTWELCRTLRRQGLTCTIDHEGGRVHRFPEGCGVTHTESAALLGFGGASAAARAGDTHGRELAALGFSVNFAPVLDLNLDPANRVIGDRAFGSDPARVGELALAYAQALQQHGVQPCGKHFPGHGASREDSHQTLPVSGASAAELERHLAPFALAATRGLPALMTAHVLYPALDPKHPATVSPTITRELLRGRLGFKGVLFSDDLDMGALDKTHSVEERVLAALEAEVDLLLFCNHRESQEQALATLWRAVDGRIIKKDRLQRSAQRIHEFQRRCTATPARTTEDLELSLG
jgi:beta-N-acetylhexosaminidase